MEYRLLGIPIGQDSPNYRGTYREEPTFQDGLPETALINQGFLAYLQYYTDDKVVSKEQAIALAKLYQERGHIFEVVGYEVCQTEERMDENEVALLLGYDINIGLNWSLLFQGLTWKTFLPPQGPLLQLIERYFKPRLNANGLFGCFSDAQFFTDVIKSYSEVFPGSFESEQGISAMHITRLVHIYP